ncbi:Gp19/Gp15/Gp42 family protein [Microbacterium sp. NPDC078814]|uniref:Gp19/Gp15/Gp42 family protein n=1 Tax=Microbacterium sp. NPDC078814 TaxID=3154767 RepID=UPI00344D40A6
MASPATITDLTERSFRPLTEAEKQVGSVLLEDAWNLILTHRPHVADRITEPAFRALVVQVQCAMVLRVVKNPDGYLSEQIDDYQYRRDAAVSAGALYVSDAELALLGNAPGAAEGAWTINTRPIGRGPGYWATTDTWVPL